MAVAYGSISTGSGASGNLTLTKPTGLSVGDLMVFVGCTEDTGSGWSSSGWSSVIAIADSTNRAESCLCKVADIADVAASDFTFTHSGNENIGVLIRVTGAAFAGATNIVYDIDQVDGQGATSYTGGVTTPSDNSLLILVGTKGFALTCSTFAVTNSNPSWTEVADFTLNTADDDLTMGVAHSIFATAGATGNYSLTYSGTTGFSFGLLLGIFETVNVTVSPAVASLASNVQAPSISADANVSPAVVGITASVQDPTVSTAASKWNNQSKNSSSFTNLSKS